MFPKKDSCSSPNWKFTICWYQHISVSNVHFALSPSLLLCKFPIRRWTRLCIHTGRSNILFHTVMINAHFNILTSVIHKNKVRDYLCLGHLQYLQFEKLCCSFFQRAENMTPSFAACKVLTVWSTNSMNMSKCSAYSINQCYWPLKFSFIMWLCCHIGLVSYCHIGFAEHSGSVWTLQNSDLSNLPALDVKFNMCSLK